MEINFDWNFKNEEETVKQINILQIALTIACSISGLNIKHCLKQAEDLLKGDK